MTVTDRQIMDALYRQFFVMFVYRAFAIVYPDKTFVPNWHIDAVCAYLQAMVEGGRPEKLVLNMPPRSLKTYIVSICFPVWLLIRNASIEIVVASYGDDIARDASRSFRTLIESDFVQRLARGKLSDANKFTESEFETGQGGGRFATSVGGTLTGRGADVLIADDPIKVEDAYSETARENANVWFDGTAYSRRNNPGHSLCIISMQRLHENDLSGYLIDKGWPVESFPLYDDMPREYDLGGGLTYVRPAGEVLQPGRASNESFEQTRQQVGTALFNAQYLQKPLPAAGNMVKREGVGYYDSPPDLKTCQHIILACDPSGKAGSGNDYTAIVVAAVMGPDMYLLNVRRGHWSCLEIVREIQTLAHQYGTTINVIETTGMGESARQELERVHRISMKGVQPKNDKVTRLSRVISKLEGKHVLLPNGDPPWLGEFERELFGFPSARYDDQTDALIMALEELSERELYSSEIPTVVLYVPECENRFSMDRFTNYG